MGNAWKTYDKRIGNAWETYDKRMGNLYKSLIYSKKNGALRSVRMYDY